MGCGVWGVWEGCLGFRGTGCFSRFSGFRAFGFGRLRFWGLGFRLGGLIRVESFGFGGSGGQNFRG